jgi:hypothetical protein
MVATGNAFALGAFETAVQRDAEVLGVLYTGSLGRGTADRYSDLDIELWVTDQAFADAPNVLRRLMGYLGTVHFMYERGAETRTTGFVGPDWQRVDLALHRQTETELAASYATARIVKDVDGSLGRSLEIRIDDAGLLAAVERIYSSPTESNRAPDRYHD